MARLGGTILTTESAAEFSSAAKGETLEGAAHKGGRRRRAVWRAVNLHRQALDALLAAARMHSKLPGSSAWLACSPTQPPFQLRVCAQSDCCRLALAISLHRTALQTQSARWRATQTWWCCATSRYAPWHEEAMEICWQRALHGSSTTNRVFGIAVALGVAGHVDTRPPTHPSPPVPAHPLCCARRAARSGRPRRPPSQSSTRATAPASTPPRWTWILTCRPICSSAVSLAASALSSLLF